MNSLKLSSFCLIRDFLQDPEKEISLGVERVEGKVVRFLYC